MKDISDVLTVSFCSGLKDESGLCVSRRCGEKTIVLKMELGAQADILYHLLTEQMTKAKIQIESEENEEVKTKKDDRDILVIKTKSIMKRDKMKEMYRNLLEQKQYGIILLDGSVDVMIVKDVLFSLEEGE